MFFVCVSRVGEKGVFRMIFKFSVWVSREAVMLFFEMEVNKGGMILGENRFFRMYGIFRWSYLIGEMFGRKV